MSSVAAAGAHALRICSIAVARATTGRHSGTRKASSSSSKSEKYPDIQMAIPKEGLRVGSIRVCFFLSCLACA